ncbi:pumilio homolog 23-like [Musa acuminata AAA Group]|uniref:pumilio homolog 23-like n=1 Tax=Musa acuminata AAA Group TaxID=214697 RepID=UPI0031D9F95B
MGEEDNLSERRKKKALKNKNHRKAHLNLSQKSSASQSPLKRKKDKKQRRGHGAASKDGTAQGSSNILKKNVKAGESSNHRQTSRQQTSSLRKMVDPETIKYFAEVANLFQKNEIDLEELPTICSNALEETRGKEVELATDMTISHTLQNLLEGCDLDRLCGFLRNSAKGFPLIATDRFGSHVAETALRSLTKHLDEEGSYSYITETLSKLCQVVITDAVSVMCSRYGSHVFRSLLCLCKGVPLDSLEEFHVSKPQAILAERLNSRPAQSGGSNSKNFQYGFPDIFKFLVSEMLNHAKDDIRSVRVNKYSSFVLQAALKLSVGDDQALSNAISILLGSDTKISEEGKFFSTSVKQEIMELLEDTASSHLLEVIVEVAPDTLYNELLTEVFKDSLFDISSHHCGNFVVQALVSSAKTKDQMDLIWKELGAKSKELLEHGKPGVVASILAASDRLQTHQHECCQALCAAVTSDLEYPSCTVPHILYLESYFRDRASWKWPLDVKMHVLGCLMLQIIFRYPKQLIQPYVTSLTLMDAAQIFQTAKDAGGSRVLEAFLCSDVSAKVKLKVITKLQDHYGELALRTSSSFTVEKCFTSGNTSLKETIAAELLAVHDELSKTKHGPYLLTKLDIDGFASRPEQWKQSQASKESAYREFHAVFGSKSKPHKQNVESPESSLASSKKKHRRHEKLSDDADAAMANSTLEFPGLEISMAKLGFPVKEKKGHMRRGTMDASGVEEPDSKKFVRSNTNTSFVKRSGKRKSSASDLADLASKSRLSAGEVQQLFKPTIKNENKQSGNEKVPFLKRQKRW